MMPALAAPDEAVPQRRRSPRSVARWGETGGQSLVWLVIVVLAAAPILPLLYASLRSQPYYLPGGTWTLHAYTSLLSNSGFRTAVMNTVIYAAAVASLAVALGTLLAVLVNRTDMPGRRWLGPSLLAPLAVPPLGLIVGWVAIYGPTGYLTDLVHKNLGLPAWDLYSLTGMIFFGAAVATPVTYLIVRASLASSNSQLEEAARSAGARPARILRSVTLPMLRPAIGNAFILVLALSVEVLGVPLILGGPKNINFVASYLYMAWNASATPDPPFVSAGGILVLVAVSLLLVLRLAPPRIGAALRGRRRARGRRGCAAAPARPVAVGRCRGDRRLRRAGSAHPGAGTRLDVQRERPHHAGRTVALVDRLELEPGRKRACPATLDLRQPADRHGGRRGNGDDRRSRRGTRPPVQVPATRLAPSAHAVLALGPRHDPRDRLLLGVPDARAGRAHRCGRRSGARCSPCARGTWHWRTWSSTPP